MERGRIEVIDALRGLGVLGILAVNASYMAGTFEQAVDVHAWPFPNEGASRGAWLAVHVFFENKFVTLFSLLFGASMYLVGGEPGDAGRNATLARRFAWLALFGAAHGALLWYGDILLDYAVCGFALMGLRGWSARRLVGVGVAALVAGVAFMAFVSTLPAFWALVTPMAAPPAAAFQGTFAGSLRANFATWTAYRGLVAAFTLPYCAPLMLVGLGLFKSGVLTGAASQRLYRAAVAAGLVALLVYASCVIRYARHGFVDELGGGLDGWLLSLTSPFISLGYAAGLILSTRTRAFAWIAPALAPLGRMAFTNYIAQSLLTTMLFYGGRGPGLFDRVDRPGLALVVAAIWAIELAWSHWWLRHHEAGPLEWLWHGLTHGRFKPNRRARASG